MASINQVERASRAWPVLTDRAAQRATITYGQLGEAIGVHHRAIRYVLGVIQDYCIAERLPPLTILIVNGSNRPGSGFIAYDLGNFDEGLESVYGFDWEQYGNPFSFSVSGESYSSLVETLTNDPGSSSDVYSLVKSRGISQVLFRGALLKAYSNRCAFTRMAFDGTLEACHIVPWSNASPSERLDVRNGLLLNCLHHKMFDRGYVTITPDHRIVYYDPKEEEHRCSPFERSLTIELHGSALHVPHQRNLRPKATYISRHNEFAEWSVESLEI